MPTKRAKPKKKDSNFYEALSLPASQPLVMPESEQAKRLLFKVSLVVVVASILVLAGLGVRSVVSSSTSQVTPAGSIVISGATAADAQLQKAETTNYYQPTSGAVQPQEETNLQSSYSDGTSIQSGSTQ